MFKNKKILLICKENFSFPLFFLAKNLLKNGNSVGAFFIHPEEGYYNKSIYNKDTYYNFKENLSEVKLYDLKNLCHVFNENLKQNKIDFNYLEKIEKDYSNFKNLNLQLTSSQLTTRHYHSRFFFHHTTFKQNQIFLELGYKRVIEVLEDFEPDVILDIEDGELLRTILNEVAFKRKIPYVNIDYPRFEGFKIPTYCLGLQKGEYLALEYARYYAKPQEELIGEYNYVTDFRKGADIMSKEFKGTITSQYEPDNLRILVKNIIEKFVYFWSVSVNSGNYKLKRKKQILYSNSIKHYLFDTKVAIKRQYLFRKNRYFEKPDLNGTYVYMPLHMIPESTTFVKAPFYINELNIIEQISKSLPINWKLYVKEHQAMVGERDFSFYSAVKKFPNVKLVKFNHYPDPKPWIQNAKGVVAISGTGAYEAAMLGKKSIVFADVPFTLIEGVYHVHSFEELPQLLASFASIDNIKSCASYLAAVKSTGMELNIKYLIAEGEKIILQNTIITEKYEKEINKLIDFFSKAYDEYPERTHKI
jgi:hypothetical protein